MVFAGLLLTAGSLGDRFGRKRLFLGGMALLGLSSVLGGLATSPGMLLVARVLQGLATAAVTPAGLSLLTTAFPEGPLRQRALVDVEPLPYAQIFNTSAWRITRLRWLITGRSADSAAGPGQTSHFDQNVFIEPNSVARLYLELGRFGSHVSISLDAAWGQPATGSATR